MKKLLIVFLALILILGGLFLWKGGHHAIALAEELEDWLDEDAADQSLTIQLNKPTFSVIEGSETITPEVTQFSFTADTFWTEYADRRIFGLSAGGYTAYVFDGILYMDTGNAYTLPRVAPEKDQIRELVTGLLLYGRVTKDGNVYRLSMEREELTISASLIMDQGIRSVTVRTEFPWDGAPVSLLATLTPKPAAAHPIPNAVTDAMVRAVMEPPMLLTEPLDILLPAMETLFPLRADVTLGVECGILSLSETVGLTIENGNAMLMRSGEAIPLVLPDGLASLDPAVMALAILRSGSFECSGDEARFHLPLATDQIGALASQLVPQLETLGIHFTEGEAILTIQGKRAAELTVTAAGEVPFLITTIPLKFTAEFQIE